MVDVGIQHMGFFSNIFLKVFDDIMSTYEESIAPIASITDYDSDMDRKVKQIEKAEELKESTVKETIENLHRMRQASETNICIKMAEEVFQNISTKENITSKDDEIVKVMKELEIDQRTARAYSPIDIKIPNYNLERTMFEWGSGGPTVKQYQLISHVVKLYRKEAKAWFVNTVSCYISFRENGDKWIQNLELAVPMLDCFTMNKHEEDCLIRAFLPGNEDHMKEENYLVDGPSLGRVFLGIDFYTKHNNVFKAFVAKTMALNPKIRERLAAQYLYKRMVELSKKFFHSQDLKYNYIRIAWERKFNYMDDYMVCLVLFIRDKTANITWDEIEEIIYPLAKEVLRACFAVSYNAELEKLAPPIEY
ncbi:hypothetical protein GCK72_024565 [Caenorhabditis remanei]|uniref:Uncharacterized protein n=1 Tax=Caenorhabditis remanei TaxID=31234 RepID=A0A6A5FZK1_CAERE|nr:hypothetical protein GCK72_024565 [Caenorhabditis remanei]KAF1748098.1 hypothetical protein GCK72_024565 [Caenorhabditis remanei]